MIDYWPAARIRLQIAEEWREEFNSVIDHDHWNYRLAGIAANRALQNALIALLAAHGRTQEYYNRITPALWSLCPENRSYGDPETELKRAVETLLEYAGDRLERSENDLEPTKHLENRGARIKLQDLLNEAIDRLTERACLICAMPPESIFPEGSPWQNRSRNGPDTPRTNKLKPGIPGRYGAQKTGTT